MQINPLSPKLALAIKPFFCSTWANLIAGHEHHQPNHLRTAKTAKYQHHLATIIEQSLGRNTAISPERVAWSSCSSVHENSNYRWLVWFNQHSRRGIANHRHRVIPFQRNFISKDISYHQQHPSEAFGWADPLNPHPLSNLRRNSESFLRIAINQGRIPSLVPSKDHVERKNAYIQFKDFGECHFLVIPEESEEESRQSQNWSFLLLSTQLKDCFCLFALLTAG